MRAPPADRRSAAASPRWSAEALVEAGETAGDRGAAAQRDRRGSPPTPSSDRGRRHARAARVASRCCCGAPSCVPATPMSCSGGPTPTRAGPSCSASPCRAKCCRRPPATSSPWPPRRAGRIRCPARRCSSSNGASATAPPSKRAPSTAWRTPSPPPRTGMTREIAEEISYLSGLKPMTGRQDLHRPRRRAPRDPVQGHRPARAALRALWRGLRRPETDRRGEHRPGAGARADHPTT